MTTPDEPLTADAERDRCPSKSAYERLLDEAIPTRPAPVPKPDQPPPRAPGPWTPEEQARHLADMLAALDGWTWDEDERAEERRHLRLITDDTDTNAA
ncbi:hypothetical protein ACIQ9J_01680 [Streptomyces sp. NPDC094153]|uniref:hypothetical protein n=1 Tax=Streptomyces sp. NPDC094153 TaxID=3366058 RepID=UPI00381CDC6B